MTPTRGTKVGPVEADQRAAPFLFVYIFAIIGSIIAMLTWVFWYRGYA